MVVVSLDLCRRRESGFRKVREEGRCRLCERPGLGKKGAAPPGARQLTRHHLVAQGWFLDRPYLRVFRSADANIIPLCRRCHDAIETDPIARGMLRPRLLPAEVELAVRLRGQGWLDLRYPPR